MRSEFIGDCLSWRGEKQQRRRRWRVLPTNAACDRADFNRTPHLIRCGGGDGGLCARARTVCHSYVLTIGYPPKCMFTVIAHIAAAQHNIHIHTYTLIRTLAVSNYTHTNTVRSSLLIRTTRSRARTSHIGHTAGGRAH